MPRELKPEKIVEGDVLAFIDAFTTFSVQVFDSKATYSENDKRYKKSKSVPEHFPDLAGNCTNSGRAVYIELKAKGKLSTTSPGQHRFLSQKIDDGCFACVVDSAERLKEIYFEWLGSNKSKQALGRHLPALGNKKKVTL